MDFLYVVLWIHVIDPMRSVRVWSVDVMFDAFKLHWWLIGLIYIDQSRTKHYSDWLPKLQSLPIFAVYFDRDHGLDLHLKWQINERSYQKIISNFNHRKDKMICFEHVVKKYKGTKLEKVKNFCHFSLAVSRQKSFSANAWSNWIHWCVVKYTSQEKID